MYQIGQQEVEVFRTNVQDAVEAKQLVELLLQFYPECIISFDLDDCDKVLRMEGQGVEAAKVLLLLEKCGYAGSVLE